MNRTGRLTALLLLASGSAFAVTPVAKTIDSLSPSGSGTFTVKATDSYGAVHFQSASGSGEASFSLEPGPSNIGSSGQWILYTNGSNLNNQNDFAFYDSELGSSVFNLISSTGYLGVGTNNPQYRMDIYGSFSTDSHDIHTDGSGDLTISGNVGGTKWEITGSDGHIAFDNSAITSNGSGALTVGSIASGSWNGSVITYTYGGTGLSSAPSNGQLPVGNGSGYTLATISQGTGITVSNGSGTISVAAAAGTPQQDLFLSCNGSNTSFSLTYAPVSSAATQAHLDGGLLVYGSSYDYTISSSTLTLNHACATGQRLLVVYGH